MAAAFHGLITNAGLMAAGMSYSYSSQKQTTSLYYLCSRPEVVAILGGKLISGYIISHDVCGRYGI